MLTAKSTIVKAVHVQELRTALDQAYDAAQVGRPSYYESVSIGSTIKKLHIDETRSAVESLEVAW